MWRILKTEISYNVTIFVIYLGMTIGVTLLERQLADGGRFYVAMLLFLIVQNWLSLKAKHKRDHLFTRLPISGFALGSVRIGMIFVSALLITIVYKGMHALLGIQGHANYPITPWKMSSYYSIVLFFFSLYFIISDVIAPRLRELSNFELIKERIIQMLIMLAILLQILGIVAFMTRASNFVTKIFELIIIHNPFDNERNVQFFLILSVLAALFSAFSYAKRKNYIR